jgi:hypothetical protein
MNCANSCEFVDLRLLPVAHVSLQALQPELSSALPVQRQPAFPQAAIRKTGTAVVKQEATAVKQESKAMQEADPIGLSLTRSGAGPPELTLSDIVDPFASPPALEPAVQPGGQQDGSAQPMQTEAREEKQQQPEPEPMLEFSLQSQQTLGKNAVGRVV